MTQLWAKKKKNFTEYVLMWTVNIVITAERSLKGNLGCVVLVKVDLVMMEFVVVLVIGTESCYVVQVRLELTV